MPTLDELTRRAHIQGTPRWAENAYAADATLGAIKYLVNNYNLYVDAIKQNTSGTLNVPHVRLVEE